MGNRERFMLERERVLSQTRERTRGSRSSMTDAEQRLWSVVRERQLGGFKFRRQHPLGVYIVDFICLEAGLVLEVDGEQHAELSAYARQRTQWMAGLGYRVLRFLNNEVLQDIEAVRERIWLELADLPPSQPSP